jgi:hypothetical protein
VRDLDNSLQTKVVAEYAASLAESGRKLQQSLDALRAHDEMRRSMRPNVRRPA